MNADEAPRIPGTNQRLGHCFEYEGNKEIAHRVGLREDCKLASKRRRNFDQPWWAANLSGLLDYTESCEHGIRFLLAVLAGYVAGNRIVDGYWYSPDETGAPHYRNDPATADELALVESLRTEVGL